MQFTKRRQPSGEILKAVFTAVLVGLMLGFAGPFGSYPAYPTATRYAFWLGLTAAGVMAVIVIDAALRRTKLSGEAARIASVTLLSAVPMTFVVAWTISLLQPGRVFTPVQLPALFAAVAAVQLLIVVTTTVTIGWDTRTAPQSDEAPSPAKPEVELPTAAFPRALLDRLPREIGPEILALETEDHYLRVHAHGGSALILMRMADAVGMIDLRLGAQVHRRWWVAQAAVMGLTTEGQRLTLRLSSGTAVPVGRTFSAAVRARFGQARDD